MKSVRQPTSEPWPAEDDASMPREPAGPTDSPPDLFDHRPASPKASPALVRTLLVKRWPLAAAAGALLIGVAWLLISLRAPRFEFETVRAERGRITAGVTATGTLSAVTTVQVGTQVSGRVAELFADFNTQVKKGQLLARLDPQLLQAAVDQAQANYRVAQGALAKARAEQAHAARDLNRARSLWKQDLMTRAEFEASDANAAAARGELAAAQGGLDQAAAMLHQASVNLSFTGIASPIDGVVISRNVDVGQTVAASLQAPTLFTIAEDPRKMQVDTNVAEADVGKLSPGMNATFTIDAFLNEKFHGTVRQIRSAAQVVQNVVTYDAVIDFDNSDLKLKPGMTANVTFVIAQKDNALKIPTAALRFRPPAELVASHSKPLLGDADRVVWKMRKGKERPKPVRVRTGLVEGATTEVVEGDIAPGDALVVDVIGGDDADRERGKKDKAPKLKVF